MAFKISDAFMAEINKDQESIPNTHNDFYYKRKNENAAIADTVNRSHLSVYCTFLKHDQHSFTSEHNGRCRSLSHK